jgi:hypothetical protein
MAIKTASGSDLRNSLSSGMVLLNTTSFSAVASQSFNNVFTSTYDNYRIVFDGSVTTGNQTFNIRLRNAGTDISSGSYFRFGFFAGSGGSTVVADLTQTSLNIGTIGGQCSSIVDIFAPKLTQTTNFLSNHYFSSGGQNFTLGSGVSVTTSCDGFTLFPGGSTITGSVSVYGYNK